MMRIAGLLAIGGSLWGAAMLLTTTVEVAAHDAAAQPGGKVLRHMVLYKFKEHVTPPQLQEVVDAFAGLAQKVETIIGFERGTNISPENKSEGFTHCFVVTFQNEAGRDAYLKHPAHDDYVKIVKDRREKVIVFDYWADAEPIRHSFFIAGPTFTGIIGEDGNEVWNAGAPAARDGYVLPNGNVLIAWSEEVKELTRDHKVVFRFQRSADNREIGTVERLKNGRTLITELGPKPRLLEVEADGTIALEFRLKPETDNAHMQTRMARKLPNGNYLVPHLLAFKVKEYSPNGEVVREFHTDLDELGGRKAETWPFTAIRLANGHTLVNLTHGNKTVELDADGHVVWQVGNDDFPEERPFADPCGGQRLPNGNTVIASYGSQGDIKVFEVTRDKKIVWTYSGPHRAHEIQMLTTNGKPVAGTPMK